MRKLIVALAALAAMAAASGANAAGWTSSVVPANTVASTPVPGGGYPADGGAPVAGTCGPQALNSNRSESWIAARPGTEKLVGASKFFVGKWSTYYDFHLGSYTVENGAVTGQNQVQGYECTTLGGTQAMPPSWTNNTDPNADFSSDGRYVYQVTLPFNAYWTNLHPDGAIMFSRSTDLGRHWQTGNGGKPLEQSPNASSFQVGHVEDKQWVAVDKSSVSQFKDRIYAAWSIFNGSSIKVELASSDDHGDSFTKATTISSQDSVGPANTYVIPSVDAEGTLYVAMVSFPPSGKATNIYVLVSHDGGATFTTTVAASNVGVNDVKLPNTRFRDGIVESFAASPSLAGHAYLTWEAWDGRQMDVYFAYTTTGGRSWSAPQLVNDNVDPASSDQFQPSVAAGSNGAVAVAFYDRRLACPDDKSVAKADRGRTNFCIDTSLQAYKDSSTGHPVATGPNTRFSTYTWDPEQPQQTIGGLGQIACASHRDPCSTTFIGDYFGLAMTGSTVYGLFVSTHYPSRVAGDGGGPIYYQQQVLASVPRVALGIG